MTADLLDRAIASLTPNPLDLLRGDASPRNARMGADSILMEQSIEMLEIAEALGDIAGQLSAPDLAEEWREDPSALLNAVAERLERLARDLDVSAGVVQDISRKIEDVLA